jgi:alkanesulfonate monooxygenase SsuD/methylene tetrahydromethanopterin reductase-like flavin-dependent oxidoreductase (luciferase family)
LADRIDDEVLHTFAIVGTPEEVASEIQRRYGDIITRITLALPPQVDAQRRAGLFEVLRRDQDSISIT